MGLIVFNYPTSQGFVVPELYLQVTSIRILKTLQGPNYTLLYQVTAFKSIADKESGSSPISLPNALAYAEQTLTANDFYDQTIFGFAYDRMKQVWEAAGFVVQDYYPFPPTPKTYIYDCSGYSFRGFNCAGWTQDGYGRDGFNKEGWDRERYGRDGFNAEGYDRDGYGRDGFNAEGYNRDGYDREGYNKDGVDKDGKYKTDTQATISPEIS